MAVTAGSASRSLELLCESDALKPQRTCPVGSLSVAEQAQVPLAAPCQIAAFAVKQVVLLGKPLHQTGR